MDILVGVHVGGDYNPGINAAKISLDDAAIKNIFRLAKRAKHGEIISTYDSTPDLGTSDLDLAEIQDIAELAKQDMGKPLSATLRTVFTDCPEEGRSDIVQLHVDQTDFWWEGMFKHTDVHWETRLIPLSFLPKPAATKKAITCWRPPFSVQSGNLPDLNMTAEQMNAIHEKIAQGMSNGLNAREIDRTFNRHVTKAQLIRLLMEHIERNH